MSVKTQKVKLEPETIPSDEISVKIPKRGKIPPSKVKTGASNIHRIEWIQVFTSTNYVPGKITFEKKE